MRIVSTDYEPTGRFFNSQLLLKNLRTNEEITSSSILEGSFSIYNKCVNSTEIEFGAVYQAECSFTLIKNQTFLKTGDSIEVYQTTENDTIQLGTYYVDDAEKTNYLTSVTMYDFMDYFNISIKENVSGTVYNVIALICSTCNVTFGQSEDDVDEFTNSEYGVSFTLSNGTYRDVISQMARGFGRFCIIKNGKLYFESFKTEVSIAYDKDYISNLKVSNYTSQYKGVYGRFLATVNYYPYTYTDSSASGATLSIGDLDIYSMDEDSKNQMLENLYTDIVRYFSYQPSSFSLTYPDCRLELGDLITIESADGTITEHYVTTLNFQSRDKITSTCVGINPEVAESTSAQYQSYIDSASSSSDVTILSNTNSAEMGSSTEYVITEFDVITTYTSIAFISATIPLTIYSDTTIKFEFYNNKVKFCSDMYKDVTVGQDIIVLNNYVSVEDSQVNGIEIIMTIEQNSVLIESGTIRNALITTATQTTAEEWNGLIEISDTMPLLSLNGLNLIDVEDSIYAYPVYVDDSTTSDTMPFVALSGLKIF